MGRKSLNLVKKIRANKEYFEGGVQAQKITITLIYISFKNLLTKNNLVYNILHQFS